MKRVFAVLLTMVMLLTLLPVSVLAETTVSSGACGAHVTWELDSEGTLTISGTGDMLDYSYSDSPFYDRTDIKQVIIQDGVTSIGDHAFFCCTGLISVTIPDSVTSIGFEAFRHCIGLTSVTIPGSVKSIESAAFELTGLTSVTISNGVTSIEWGAFNACTELNSVTIPYSVTYIGSAAFGYCYDEEDRSYTPKDGFTITGYSGSAAEVYAAENGSDFVSLGQYMAPGDVDGNGGVTAADALMALQAATGKVMLDDTATANADVDGTPGITANDALLILQCATQKITALG